MAVDLAELADAAHTAVLTMEMQRGIIGDLAALPDLAGEAADLGIVAATARLLGAARGHGIRVVHCVAEFRADRAGSAHNAPLFSAMSRSADHLVVGTPSAELVGDLGPQPSDLMSSRSHGLSPFGGTSLDVTLRNLGVTTVVATGVSVNLGVLGLAIEAVNLGYRVVVATDAVCGFPRSYAQDVMRYSMGLVATRVTVAELVAAWSHA